MEAACAKCECDFRREPGFYLGTIYFNYGLTAVLVTITYLVLSLTKTLGPPGPLLITLVIAVLFPIWFFRYARSLWLGFDHYLDPPAS